MAMATYIDAEQIDRELQQRLNNRMHSVRALVKSRQAVEVARDALNVANDEDTCDALNVAKDEDARCYQAALGIGWTVNELRSSGLSEPENETAGTYLTADGQKLTAVDIRKTADSSQPAPTDENVGSH